MTREEHQRIVREFAGWLTTRETPVTFSSNRPVYEAINLVDEYFRLVPPASLENELATLLNRYSVENGSNTPDFILASFLLAVLQSWNAAVQRREVWYGRGSELWAKTPPEIQST